MIKCRFNQLTNILFFHMLRKDVAENYIVGRRPPMLAEIYGWFTEGGDTSDLQEAKTLRQGFTS
jgi:hypothetical protein